MQKITLGIEGMMCANCAKHVVEAVEKVPSVTRAEASHEAKQAVVTAKDGVDVEAIKTAVSELGYTVTSVTAEEQKKKGLFGMFKKK